MPGGDGGAEDEEAEGSKGEQQHDMEPLAPGDGDGKAKASGTSAKVRAPEQCMMPYAASGLIGRLGGC